MFSNKDIEHRKIFVIDGLEHRKIKLVSYQLGVYDTSESAEKCLTKIPFHKLLAVFIVGHTSITSPLIERFNKNNVPLIVVKPNWRSVFFIGATAEANFLLREKQHLFSKEDLEVGKALMHSKISNQILLLKKTREQGSLFIKAIEVCQISLKEIPKQNNLQKILAYEGNAAKAFFTAYYSRYGWKSRMQRTKIDAINATMDIGYTILFNFIEANLRMFGFDLYVGVYHRLWFQRKSLVCDLVEPFRCLIDKEIRKSFNYKKFSAEDFEIHQNRFFLKSSSRDKYNKVFFEVLKDNKMEIFIFIRDYYRCFMGRKSVREYPTFLIS